MKTEKRLSDVTRANSANKANKFADSLMPAAPKPRIEQPIEPQQPPTANIAEVIDQQPPELPARDESKTDNPGDDMLTRVTPTVQATPTESARVKSDRSRKAAFNVEDVINGSAKEGDVFNKMVRVTDDHHELLRLMAFKYRKPMNVIVHNLIAMLDQVYQKDQKGGQSDV